VAMVVRVTCRRMLSRASLCLMDTRPVVSAEIKHIFRRLFIVACGNETYM
jgi:hypothetical protein